MQDYPKHHFSKVDYFNSFNMIALHAMLENQNIAFETN